MVGPQDYHAAWTVSVRCHLFETHSPVLRLSTAMFSLILKKIFLFKCNLSMLRLTAMLSLLALPVVLTPLIAYHKRERPPSSLTTPLLEAVILASFPLAWFYGFLYYTEVPSLVSVLSSVVLASQGKHWLAALVRFDSSECHFGGRFTEDKRGS